MIQISLTIGRAQLASIEQALLDHGACSVTLRDAADDPVLEPLPGEAPAWPTVIVTGLYADDIDTEPLQRRLHGMLAGRPALEITRVAEQDWSQVWKHDCTTLTFGRRLRVCRGDGPQRPDPERDDPVRKPSSVDLFLDPGLAFGTGDHPTTALCLEWLDANPPRDREVIDYGCGSGILGLAALKLGARRAYAVDIDPQALFATRDNAARNGIEPHALLTYSPEELPMHAADLLLANIVARPLMGLAQTFAMRVMPGGRVVLSGLLTGQADVLAAVYAPWFAFAPVQEKGGWSLLTGRRRPPSRWCVRSCPACKSAFRVTHQPSSPAHPDRRMTTISAARPKHGDTLMPRAGRVGGSTCHSDYRLPSVIPAAKKMLERVGSFRRECHDRHPVSHRALTSITI